ncbi:DEAD/DEAH box helicase [Salinibacterium sp. NSLL150]|uniref:DEAD/DEAH box helicase n=1 Tax=unclassified Salinibacterium TaxID=2632331 RepID=UPI0018CFCB9E|nr:MULTISPECIES: DEAD/DEAH box helicase [unclassified Salinibacterium]MBH0099187.1 DEAD/DEAH box helicase [Salinibacterium sp. NSLL35]MBH0101941.1 DEAD/DEAH box helicase [Salinibacterium sp. NSLL150]MBH0104701.1 DEAD/DEAH box helicase [Salinibacterium sp. NSLL16]MBH0107461.1 DEAD/DEAH box helicase [Salinibacterium sp. NSLL17]MBH0108762.1 DEAD/DEAH box helicase [Salinibacterium sp. NG22]
MTELSPAERYAAAKKRRGYPVLEAFRASQRFDLDEFQISACQVVEDDKSVLVAAPTGAGKTIIAEFAIYRAMQLDGPKVFYTAPMKALSNQKFQELVAEYGPENVGLLTGDTNVNASARIVVMTTEVLRNMLYAKSDLLKNLSTVVMDEVHFLGDRFRGAVWEEVIIHLPEDVHMVSLSATVSNAEEFGDWLQAVRGDTEVIVSEDRPVPLEQHVLVGTKLIDLFDSSGLAATNRVNPELAQMARFGGRSQSVGNRRKSSRHDSRGGRPARSRMDRADVVAMLSSKNLVPAIFFIFSRMGCDQAVNQVLRAGVRLTTSEERDEIREIVEARCRTLLDEDLAVLGYWDWLSGLERGVAAHHAGLLPAFKEVVEELFQKKLVKAVFATETLALGINMPARTVVLEKLEKFNGEARVPITPGEYTQLTGRAGRRGIDIEGHSVIQWVDGLDPQAVASLASRRTYPLNSSFKPTYNMAVNLIELFGREHTREILESSFAQFQADRAVVDLARKVRSQKNSLDGYAKSMECHLGDFGEYSRIRRELNDLEKKSQPKNDAGHRAERERRQRKLADLRRQMRKHECHACPERESHARWAERWWRLKRETDQLTRQIQNRTGAVAKIFDRVTDVLTKLGYIEPGANGEMTINSYGRTLRRIYGERDLLVAESLRHGFWNELDAPSLAAMATTLVYEPRRDEGDLSDRYLPRGAFREAFDKTTTLWAELDDLERDNRLPGSQPLAAGLALAMYRWANGANLDSVLDLADMAAGDFVRVTKQTIDLLDQLSVVADGNVGPTARKALDGIRRGIVAYSSVA